MPADYHTHTPLCRHARGEPEEFVERALAAGLSEYGIADHAPQRPEPFDDWRMLEAELPDYLAWVGRARRHAAGRIPVRAGLECDWLDGCQPWIEHLARLARWDYLIGSVHYLGRWDFDNPAQLARWAGRDVAAVWADYWAAYAAMAASGLFDLLGHPDLVKKFGHRPAGDLRRYYGPAVEAIAAAGRAGRPIRSWGFWSWRGRRGSRWRCRRTRTRRRRWGVTSGGRWGWRGRRATPGRCGSRGGGGGWSRWGRRVRSSGGGRGGACAGGVRR